MGWAWKDDDSSDFPETSSSPGIGELGIPASASVDSCSMRRVIKSRCILEEIEPDKFLNKCEKTEQILRECVGRPVEVVESHIEYSEEDVTNKLARGGSVTSEFSSGMNVFSFPGLQNDLEDLEHNMRGGLSRFMEATEDMKNGFSRFMEAFQSFGLPSVFERDSRLDHPRPSDGLFEEGHPSSKEKDDSAYAEYAGKVRDV